MLCENIAAFFFEAVHQIHAIGPHHLRLGAAYMDATGRGDLLGVCGFQLPNRIRLSVHMGVGQPDAAGVQIINRIDGFPVVPLDHRFLAVQGQRRTKRIFPLLAAQLQKRTVLSPVQNQGEV